MGNDEDGGGSDGDKVDIVCKVGARLVNVFATALCLPSVINIIVITCHLLLLKADNPLFHKLETGKFVLLTNHSLSVVLFPKIHFEGNGPKVNFRLLLTLF